MLALGCGHASRRPAGRRPPSNSPSSRASGSDASATAAQLSEETRALLRAEGELLWTRWTTGSGPLPASALAEHPRLLQPESIDTVSAAAARSSGSDAVALSLLSQQLATLAVSREAGAEIDALERARSQLAFPAPGETRATLGERDLDRLLRDEPKAQKRAALAQAEAKVAQTLAPLAIARDAAVDKAIAALGLQSWAAVQERAYGIPLDDLARLAESTLDATERVGARAVSTASVRNLGITADRLRRVDLPRLARTALADPQFTPGKAWPTVRDVLALVGAPPPPGLRVDAEPSPSKGAGPLGAGGGELHAQRDATGCRGPGRATGAELRRFLVDHAASGFEADLGGWALAARRRGGARVGTDAAGPGSARGSRGRTAALLGARRAAGAAEAGLQVHAGGQEEEAEEAVSASAVTLEAARARTPIRADPSPAAPRGPRAAPPRRERSPARARCRRRRGG